MAGTQIDRVELVGVGVRIDAHTTSVSATCPVCGVVSTRVHSRYLRRLSDFSIAGREVLIRLRVRHFFCIAPACERGIFTERLDDVAVAHARRTSLAGQVLRSVGLALGGRAGARLAEAIALPVNRTNGDSESVKNNKAQGDKDGWRMEPVTVDGGAGVPAPYPPVHAVRWSRIRDSKIDDLSDRLYGSYR